MKANIAVVKSTIHVLPNKEYDCLNVTGNQPCLKAVIYEDEDLDGYTEWNYIKGPLGVCVSDRIPVCLFYGKKEGDEVVLKYLNKDGEKVDVTLKLCQQSDEKFEDILYELTISFGGNYNPSHDEPSSITQYAYMITTHDQYASSIGKPIIPPNEFRYSSSWIKCITEESKKTPKLGLIERMTAAMSDLPIDTPPVAKLGYAMLKVDEDGILGLRDPVLNHNQ